MRGESGHVDSVSVVGGGLSRRRFRGELVVLLKL
jgi:hypothetical protein